MWSYWLCSSCSQVAVSLAVSVSCVWCEMQQNTETRECTVTGEHRTPWERRAGWTTERFSASDKQWWWRQSDVTESRDTADWWSRRVDSRLADSAAHRASSTLWRSASTEHHRADWLIAQESGQVHHSLQLNATICCSNHVQRFQCAEK